MNLQLHNLTYTTHHRRLSFRFLVVRREIGERQRAHETGSTSCP